MSSGLPPEHTETRLEESWLPFNFSDLWCAGDRRAEGTPVVSASQLPPSRPLQGLALHFPAPIDPMSSMRATIRGMGGQIVSAVDGSTHVIVKSGLSIADLKQSLPLRRALKKAQANSVCVVEQSWVAAVAALTGDADWASVDVAPYIPPVMALLDDDPELSDEYGGTTARSQQQSSGHQGLGSSLGYSWFNTKPAETMDVTDVDSVISKKAAARPGITQSLGETWRFLKKAHPEQVEEDLLAKAIERSLLDFAIQLRHVGRGEPGVEADPYTVLGVKEGASVSAIRQAYRRRALETHPDRGGTPGTFLQVQHAYRRLTEKEEESAAAEGAPEARRSKSRDEKESRPLLHAPKIDLELKEHRALVEAWFDRDGVHLDNSVQALESATSALGLKAQDVGATNKNENGDIMYNQCFYLSLARSFLRDDGKGNAPARPVIAETALHFKRVVEAAVLRAHPEWADTQVGEDLQAFSDFLFYVLNGANALLSELAIAVFDSTSGGVELYRGLHYPDPSSTASPSPIGKAGGSSGGGERIDEDQQRANLLCIKYLNDSSTPGGHYQSLVTQNAGASGPTLVELLKTLDACGVMYVITDSS